MVCLCLCVLLVLFACVWNKYTRMHVYAQSYTVCDFSIDSLHQRQYRIKIETAQHCVTAASQLKEHIPGRWINHSLLQKPDWRIVRWCLICLGRMAAAAWPRTIAFSSTLYLPQGLAVTLRSLTTVTVDWRERTGGSVDRTTLCMVSNVTCVDTFCKGLGRPLHAWVNYIQTKIEKANVIAARHLCRHSEEENVWNIY